MQSNARHIGSISLRRDEKPRGKNTFENPIQKLLGNMDFKRCSRDLGMGIPKTRAYPNHCDTAIFFSTATDWVTSLCHRTSAVKITSAVKVSFVP